MLPVQCFVKPKSSLLSRASALVIAASLAASPALANPLGGRVVAGSASITGQGSAEVTVTQGSNRALIEWDSFSIEPGERTVFRQPNADAIAANRVVGADPSKILGTLEADGQVVLINRNGILFGKNARVDAAGLVATTHDIDNTAFMSGGPLRFDTPGAHGASVVNEGRITIREAGVAALVAPHVRNSGVILADLGRVSLGAGEGFTLDLYGDGLVKFAAGDEVAETLTAPDGTPLKALVENDGEIAADGGRVLLTASAAREVVNQSVNVSGIVRAQTVSRVNGVIRLAGPGAVKVETDAVLSASGEDGGGRIEVDAGLFTSDGIILADGAGDDGEALGAGGDIAIEADTVGLGGLVSASGKSGGTVSVEAAGRLSLAETVKAVGALGEGGAITYTAGRMMETSTGSTDASGLTHGGTITVKAETQLATSGFYTADGLYGEGGRIDMTADDVRLLSASLSARGRIRGGRVRVGGAFQGGKAPDPAQPYHDSFVARWEGGPGLDSARMTFVNDASVIDVSSRWGEGGTAVVWADEQTTFLGAIDARGEGGGGSVEISAAGNLRHASLDGVSVGAGGHLLIDPKNIVIADQPAVISNWAYSAIIGLGYTKAVDPGLGPIDEFGAAVSLNAAGDRLAVGAPVAIGDDGGGGLPASGAVFLFSFTDANFSGGVLEATIGFGLTGGKNVDLTLLEAGDRFGRSVSLNAAGDRLAAGAFNDDGNNNGTNSAGAVYLFSFTDTEFSGGVHEATIGSGYAGGKNVNLATLGNGDLFGASVALNAAGDRLAVGARGDDGAGDGTNFAGAVYLFSFTDADFSGGVHEATIGLGYTGGKDIDLTTLADDVFGASVSLNAAGDRLAVGAYDDDGAGDGTNGAGAVYLFSFTDTDFSGGFHEATIGEGYTGGKDVNLTTLDNGDAFGVSVSLNAAGDRLAVGANGDGGSGDGTNFAGAAYLFSFTDGTFSGGAHEATIGEGYTGGKNVDVSRLDVGDEFGASVSLNAAGDRLAVGADQDRGAQNTAAAGAVYLFSFTDTAFSGGQHEAILGTGYVGDKNINLARLEGFDSFGAGVALNGAGNLLAVGAPGDDGFDEATSDSGAVYLFSFTDTNYSGGVLEGVIGAGYTGGKNIDVAASIGVDDFFGEAVALNGAGNLLAVGSPGDDGAGDATPGSGAVRLFSFTDTSFSGGVFEATIGAGYTGGKNVDMTSLDDNDNLGRSVALNAAGDRLAAGAFGDDGAGDARNRTGAVHLLSFTDTSFSGGALEATIGRDYTGGKDIDVTALEDLDNFGTSVALNAAGNLLAAGAYIDDGAGNNENFAGAVYLFSFTDTVFSGGVLEATIGDGYTGGKSVNLALDNNDQFGVSVSLNAVGNRLAVGAFGDDGAGNGAGGSGSVRLISFTDTSFSGGAVESTFGVGYSGADDVDLTGLLGGDSFGYDVSLNAAGDRLAVGAFADAGVDDGIFRAGATYLFAADSTGGSNLAGAQGFGSLSGDTVFVAPDDIAAQLAAGTAVTLQASNDITVTEAITVTGTPAIVGALTLQAGRSVLVNDDITTVGGDVTLIANETLANGVIDAERDAGAATITMAAGTHIDAGAGRVLLELRDGAGKTHADSGLITLESITADRISVVNNGPTAGSGVTINTGATLTATSATDDAIVIAGDVFTNNAGAGALSTTGAGRYLVYSEDPSMDNRGGLAYDFKQYNAALGDTVLGDMDENGFLYTIAPVITVELTGTVSKTYDATDEASLGAGNYTPTGAIDGDNITLNNPAVGLYDTKNAGTGKTVTADGLAIDSATDGAARVFGYQLASTSANANIGEIEQLVVTITGVTANDKIYNRTTNATLDETGSIVGILLDDELNLDTSGVTAFFANANVGAGIDVTATGFALSGADAGNYQLAVTSAMTTAAITPVMLTVDLIGAVMKQYDATVDASLTAGNYDVTGVLGPDDVVLNNPIAGTYNDKNVGTGKRVTVTGLALSGADAGNYELGSTSVSAEIGEITRAPVTIDGLIIDDKDYDGNTSARLSGGGLDGVFSGDELNFDTSGATALFVDKDAGTGKAVTVSGIVLGGGDAGNYALTQPTGLTADIRQAVLTVSGVTAENKEYDATTDATLGGTLQLVGIIGDDVVIIDRSAETAFFADKNAGTDKAVTVSGFTLSGGDAGNYALTQPMGVTADITRAMVTIAGTFTALDKIYDGTTLASIDTAGLTLMDVLSGDDVSLDTVGATGSFADKNVGTGKTVSLSVSGALTGVDAGNYELASGAPTATASITRATVTVDLVGSILKQYDATVDALLTAGNYDVTGVFGPDDVTLNNPVAGTYSDKNAGTGKLVTVTGLALSGADAGNYQLAATNASAAIGEITRAPVTIDGLIIDDKDYDATTSASFSGGALDGVFSGDDLILEASGATALFANRNAGTGKAVTVSGFALSGGDAGNYDLTQPTGLTADIARATVTIAGAFTALDKIYDGTMLASIDAAGLTLMGVLSGDDADLDTVGATGSFTDKNVGTGKTVSLSVSGALTGADAGNYALAPGAPTATADITPATLTVIVDDAEREQNDPNPPFTYSISGFVSGEDESLVSGVAANTSATAASPLGEYAITASGGVADNYRFVYQDGTLTVTPVETVAEITPADPVNDLIFRAPPLTDGGVDGGGPFSLTDGEMFDGLSSVTIADGAGVDGRSPGGALFAPDAEGIYWTGNETEEDEFIYRRIQPKTNVDISVTREVIYVGYPDQNN